MAANVVTREQVTAFRLRRHNLARRLPAGSLVEAAAICGVQNSPPGAALVAFHARVEGVPAAALDDALAQRSLVQLWSVRAAPLFVPVTEAAVFTTGLLPEGEDDVRFLIRGAWEHLDRLSLPATELVERVAAALPALLDGRELTKDELGAGLSRALEGSLPPDQRPLWNSPDEWGRFGESLARFALNVVALTGAFCVISHRGRAATFARTDQWLGRPFAPLPPDEAAAELLRRYLRAYGPSSAADFALWAGIAPQQARRTWRRVEPQLAAVTLEDKTRYLLREDLPLLAAGEPPCGVRLLPPHDVYLAARDRLTLLPDKRFHADVWRAVNSPGAVLSDGEIVGTWRAQAKNGTLHAAVTSFAELSRAVQDDVEAEFSAVAPLRGCRGAALSFATPHDVR